MKIAALVPVRVIEKSKSGIHAPHRGRVRVGTASWSDPGFVEDWYPTGLAAGKRLAWYAEHFDLVEVNSTFYAVPSEKMVERWCQQTPDDFVFDVKLHRLLSLHSTPVALLPRDLRAIAKTTPRGRVELTSKVETALARRFLDGIAPLADCKKLGAVLLQLSPAFRPRHHQLNELDHVVGLFKGHPLAVELRNRDWVSEQHLAATVAYFRKHRLVWVTVDAPESDHFMVMPPVDVVTDKRLAYLRAHGRNAHGYVTGRSVPERFDYQYTTKEVKEIAARAETLATLASETHVVFNNNKSSYAPKAAERFRQVVGEKQH